MILAAVFVVSLVALHLATRLRPVELLDAVVTRQEQAAEPAAATTESAAVPTAPAARLARAPERPVARTTGVGGVVRQIVFTQAGPAKLIWGDEPRYARPTSTRTTMQAGDWSLGPAAVLVRLKDPSILGAPTTTRWTVMPDSDGTAISQFCVQPVFRWSRAHGWTIAFNRVITANWQAAGRWTVPQGLGVSHVAAIGPMSVGLGITSFDTVVHSPGTGSSQFRLVTSFLFPKAHAK